MTPIQYKTSQGSSRALNILLEPDLRHLSQHSFLTSVTHRAPAYFPGFPSRTPLTPLARPANPSNNPIATLLSAETELRLHTMISSLYSACRGCNELRLHRTPAWANTATRQKDGGRRS